MRGSRPFRQRDVTAAVKAVAAAGQRVDRVEIFPDRIVVITVRPGDDQPTAQNEVDKWLAEHAGPTKGR